MPLPPGQGRRGGRAEMKGEGLLPLTLSLALPQSVPCPPGSEVRGSLLPHASAPGKSDLLVAQGSFQMKEKVKPHTQGQSAYSMMNGACVTQ